MGFERNAKKKYVSWRPIRITAAICLDFAHPSTFATLSSSPDSDSDTDTRAHYGPDLILAPGKTWDLGIGEVMHEQVRQRADELGAVALWCDGDSGGLSGVVGRGESGIQRGRRSFVRNLAIPYHDDASEDDGADHRTLYSRWGDWTGIAVVWAAVLASLAFSGQQLALPAGSTLGGIASQPVSYVRAGVEKAKEVVGRLRRRNAPEGNLIDF